MKKLLKVTTIIIATVFSAIFYFSCSKDAANTTELAPESVKSEVVNTTRDWTASDRGISSKYYVKVRDLNVIGEVNGLWLVQGGQNYVNLGQCLYLGGIPCTANYSYPTKVQIPSVSMPGLVIDVLGKSYNGCNNLSNVPGKILFSAMSSSITFTLDLYESTSGGTLVDTKTITVAPTSTISFPNPFKPTQMVINQPCANSFQVSVNQATNKFNP
jgi:hypothetical protein